MLHKSAVAYVKYYKFDLVNFSNKRKEMEEKINFRLKMEKELSLIEKEIISGRQPPKLLLHGCCAPCSSYVLEYLNRFFRITSFYYNPNISEAEEYDKRVKELQRLINEMPVINKVSMLEGRYDTLEFDEAVAGLEKLGERSSRCYACYELRLRETAAVASREGFDYFTTTLSISPYKDAKWINEIGERVGREYNVKYLYADFKKKNGYKRSIELSNEYGLYRQNYCGCKYSKAESLKEQSGDMSRG